MFGILQYESIINVINEKLAKTGEAFQIKYNENAPSGSYGAVFDTQNPKIVVKIQKINNSKKAEEELNIIEKLLKANLGFIPKIYSTFGFINSKLVKLSLSDNQKNKDFFNEIDMDIKLLNKSTVYSPSSQNILNKSEEEAEAEAQAQAEDFMMKLFGNLAGIPMIPETYMIIYQEKLKETLLKALITATPEETIKYNSEVLNNLEKLHKINIVHGDLKIDNIMLNDSNKIYFIDFGQATDLNDNEGLDIVKLKLLSQGINDKQRYKLIYDETVKLFDYIYYYKTTIEGFILFKVENPKKKKIILNSKT